MQLVQLDLLNLLKQEKQSPVSIEIHRPCHVSFVKNNSAACSTSDIYTLDSHPISANRSLAKATTIHLKRGEVMRLEKNSRVKNIEAKNGIVWLTATPADGDILLRAGELFELQNNW